MSSDASISPAPKQEGSLRLPRRFGRYALFDFIGKGGMAEIFLARATTELGAARLCVVKQIIPEYAKHPQFAEMLIHEAKLAARLNHAHIVQVFDLGRADDSLYIAMEYVEGFDLNALLRRCSAAKVPLPFEFALGIVGDVLKGLDYAHRRTDDEGRPLGIVHRDVSPSNVLISLEGEVKLCDFGIAHANDLVRETGTVVAEAIKGKAGYMSPEHARGEPIDARADVFAVGILLWELLAGKRMYRKEAGGPSLLEMARRAEIPALPPKGLPHEERLYGIVSKALAKKEERYVGASAMLRDLSGYMSEAKLVASPLRLGTWLVDHFGQDLLEQRRLRDRHTPDPSSVPASMAHSQPPLPAAGGVAAAVERAERVSSPPRAPSSGPTSIAPSAIASSSSPAVKLETVVKEPDPPSLAASTFDVVPSSDMQPDVRPAPPPPARKARALTMVIAALVLALAVVGALVAMR